MKRICLVLAVYVGCFSIAWAQNQPPSTSNPAAFLELNGLYAKDTGIPEFVEIGNALEKEFSGATEELRNLWKQYDGLTNEIEKITKSREPSIKRIEELIRQARELELDVRIRQEKFREAYFNRRTEMSSRLMPQIEATLADYARQRAIVVVYICSDWKEQCSRFLSSRNVTSDFVDFMLKPRSPNN